MKKSIFHILAVAFAGLSFSACQSEFKAPDASATHTVVFSAEQVATKTGLSIDGTAVHYAWKQSDTEGDKFKVFENGVEADLVVPELKDGKMSITATFPGEETPANAKYLARFNSGVNASQFGDETEYAQDSDVLVSEEAEGDISGEGILFRFTRVSAFGQMTLKNLGKGEFVNSVTIETADGKILAAEYDFANNQFAAEGSATLNIETLSTIANNQAVVRFVTVPVQDAMLKITATTIDGDENVVATYEKTFTKSISFSAGDLFAFGALMEEKSSEPSNKFIKVTNTPDPWAGEYLLAYCPNANTARVFNGLDAADDYVEASIANDAIELAEGMVVISIESVSGGYSLKIVGGEKDGNYIYGKSGSNSIQYGNLAIANELSFADGAVTILSNSTTFRYNSASGNDRFRYYKTTTTGASYISPTLFKREGEIQKVAVTGVTINPTTVSIEEGTNTTLTATVAPDDATDKSVTWKSDDTSVATVDGNGLVTAIAAGTTTITATTADGGHTATCEVTVYAQVINEVSIAEFLAAEVGGTEWYKLTGEITNIANIKYGNFTIQDATGSVYVYGLASAKGSDVVAFSDHTINEGDIITFIGKRGVHEGTQGEEDEVVDAYYVSHTPAPSISLNPTSVVFAANGGNEEITVTTENFSGDVTITASSNNPQFTTSINGNKVTISANANTTSDNIPGEVAITATANEVSKSATVSVTQNKPVAAAEDGTTLWSESFAGFKAEDVPAFSNNETIVYGGGSVAYSCINGGSATKIYTGAMSAGGTSPELLVSKSNGSFTVSGLPTGNASVMTLTYKTNNKCAITSNSNITIQELSYSEKVVTALITAENGVATFDLVFTNNTSNNSRVDDFLLVAGFEKFNPEITGTDKNLTLGNTLDVSTMFSSDSDGAFRYGITGDNASNATISNDNVFSASVTGTYTIRATQSATDIYNEGTAEATITVSAQSTKGTVRITRDCFPSGSLAYNVTDSWSATASTGETVTGEGDLYSTVNQTTLQSKNSGVSTMYHNTVAIPGNITKITLKCASGNTRTYTAYMNKTTAITSTSGGTSKGTIAPTAGNTASLAFNKEDGWRYFWLNLAGGTSYLDYIEIEYEK